MINLRLGEILTKYGYVTQSQIDEALKYQQSHKGQRIGDILISLGFITESQMLDALARRLGLKMVSFDAVEIDINSVKLIPKQLCLKYNLIAFAKKNGILQVAVNDPLDYYAFEDVRVVTNTPMEIFLCEKSTIVSQIEYFYSEIEAREVTKSVVSTEKIDADISLEGNDETPAVKLLNTLLIKGYNSSASDIHIEPFEKLTLVRIRIDGMIVEYANIEKSLHPSIIARIKILANLNIAEKRVPQDGHFKIVLEGIELNIRVSIIPTVYGEKAVLRFLSINCEIDNSGTFGMTKEDYAKMNYLLGNPYGIIYITGPTGSGKTTTLYMAIEKLAKRAVNISTIEDPVERNINRINQMQVNVQAGLTFGAGLRALLRQDPDIILVGETRDAETASISVSAALTGHLVLSTLHTNDAVSTIVRLANMGVDNYMISNAVKGVVAQRLVRKICPNCKEEYIPTSYEKALIGKNVEKLYRGVGCHVCNNTGYKGRQAIHEIFVIDKEVVKMISSKAPIEQIYDYVVNKLKMRTLYDSMTELVVNGITTTEELKRINYNI